jgi:DNA repair photolyase
MRSKPNRQNTYGTREWAIKTINCCTGCPHDCRYCYAKAIAVRFKRMTAAKWPFETIRQHDVDKDYRKFPGRVMMPSSHDITPTNLAACMTVLKKLLQVGNEVLIVSKPHLNCIEAICSQLCDYRKQVLFRFTIGACDSSVLSFWEPGAPAYSERMASLQYVFEHGFQTSVSVEPMLDTAKIDQLVAEALPYVTETIWIGKMNHLGRVSKKADAGLRAALQQIEAGQTDDIIRSIYERHKGNPRVKWKASIKKVVGLPLVS